MKAGRAVGTTVGINHFLVGMWVGMGGWGGATNEWSISSDSPSQNGKVTLKIVYITFEIPHRLFLPQVL